MADEDDLKVELRLLADGDDCGKLKLGDAEFQPLKTFLKSNAKRFHKTNLARTFVVVEQGTPKVKAYVTVLCTHVSVQDVNQPEGEGNYPYADYPALRLARLAVDSRLQGMGLGSDLVDFVLSLARDQVMPHVGCRFLIVDAKPKSVSFYRRKGFSTIGEVPAPEQAEADGAQVKTTLMFVDLHRLQR